MNKILDRIKRLLALAQSDNPHEAALAASEAQRLMIQNGIESVTMHEQHTADQVLIDAGSMNVWYRFLANDVAKATFCSVYAVRTGKAGKCAEKLSVCGYKQDIAVAIVLLTWLANEINRLCELAWAPLRSSGVSANAWKKSFRLGATSVIGKRLAEDRVKSLAEVGTALVKLDTYTEQSKAAVVALLRNEGISIRTKGVVADAKDQGAYGAGLIAGAQVALKPPSRALPSK